jgi:hypothetical protein
MLSSRYEIPLHQEEATSEHQSQFPQKNDQEVLRKISLDFSLHNNIILRNYLGREFIIAHQHADMFVVMSPMLIFDTIINMAK